ncbi:hypothetical protein B296_00020975 [Ensete ventricosum]|uniref:Uncharacterized protein n=1 Tax=Ensete ventricosum TaxID=4639 RepID=A0A426YYF6_ENSVE|nr:hypothetical protein B296_00020975 [Ensete ventricosum]
MLPRSVSHGHKHSMLGPLSATVLGLSCCLRFPSGSSKRSQRSSGNINPVAIHVKVAACLCAGKDNFSVPSPLTHWKEKIHVHQKQTFQDCYVPYLSWHVDSCTCSEENLYGWKLVRHGASLIVPFIVSFMELVRWMCFAFKYVEQVFAGPGPCALVRPLRNLFGTERDWFG